MSSPDELDFSSIRNSQINDSNTATEVLSEEKTVFANRQQDRILATWSKKAAGFSRNSAAAYCFQTQRNNALTVEPSSIQTSISTPRNFDIEASSLTSRSQLEGQTFVSPPMRLGYESPWVGKQAERQQLGTENWGCLRQLDTSPQSTLIPLNIGSGPTEDSEKSREQKLCSIDHILNGSEHEGSRSSTSDRAMSRKRGRPSIDADGLPFLSSKKRVHRVESGFNESSKTLPIQHPLLPISSQRPTASLLPHEYKAQPPSSYFTGSSFGSAIQAGPTDRFRGAPGVPDGHVSPGPRTQTSSLITGSGRKLGLISSPDASQVPITSKFQALYNVPVNVHQASKAADEKRARNAEASSRFRTRRKEKEKANQSTVQRLEQVVRGLERRVQDAEQDRDRYRCERDMLRSQIQQDAVPESPSQQILKSGWFPCMR